MEHRLDEAAVERAVGVILLLRKAIQNEDVREIARLRLHFPEIIERRIELHDYLDYLYKRRRTDAISAITGEVRRGRPFGSFRVVALVDMAMKKHDERPAKAAQRVAASFGS